MIRPVVITALVALQVVCAVVFILKTFSAIIGFEPIAWRLHELVEISAAMGLVIGAAAGLVLLRRSIRHAARIESQMRAASGAFVELMEEKFDDWGLTPAERDVALFSIKGLSTAEIAAIRETSEGTVKAQTGAIYRKAGVSGRPQLLSLFIEDLIDGPLGPRPDVAIPQTSSSESA